jgi:hypothetical protein
MNTNRRRIRIIKKGEDDSNVLYWITLSYQERMQELERMRQEVIKRFYGDQQGFQRVLRITKRA